MTTYLIYAGSNDGDVISRGLTYALASGTGGARSVRTTGTGLVIGQQHTEGNYFCYQSFLAFNTSVITTTDEIVDARIGFYGTPQFNRVDFAVTFRLRPWTSGGLTIADWVVPATLNTLPLLGSVDFRRANGTDPKAQWNAASELLLTNINKTGATEVVASTNRFELGAAPLVGDKEYFTLRSAEAANVVTTRPVLIVQSVAQQTLNMVGAAAVQLSDGTHVSVRSDGGVTPALTIGASNLTAGTTWTQFSTLPVGGSGQVYNQEGLQNIALAAGPDDSVYVIYPDAARGTRLVMRRFRRVSGVWSLLGVFAQDTSSNRGPINSIAATYVPAATTGGTPSIFVIFSNKASQYRSLSWATMRTNLVTGSTASLFIQNGIDPAWMLPASWPVGTILGGGLMDVSPLPNRPTRIAVTGYYTSMVDVVNGVPTGPRRGFLGASASRIVPGAKARIFGLDSGTAVVFHSDGANVYYTTFDSSLNAIRSGTAFALASAGDTPEAAWDAWYNPLTGLVTFIYCSSVSPFNNYSLVTFNPLTGVASTATTTTLGSASTTNVRFRLPRGPVDERRLLMEVANVTNTTTRTTLAASLQQGNVAPNAPVLGPRAAFDAATASTFTWAFSDDNSKDTQTAYQLTIERVSDSVVVVDSGKVTSTLARHTVAANALANDVPYRWRVRTYDALNTVGTYSGYANFTTSAAGTLAITEPATDNEYLENAEVTLTWVYTQSAGRTQAKRRVVVTDLSTSTVFLDTGMVTTTSPSYEVTGLVSNVPYSISVTIENNAGVVSPAAVRLVTPTFSKPMIPQVSLGRGEAWVEVVIENPDPTGDRPQVETNRVYRQEAGIVDAPVLLAGSVGYSGILRDYTTRSGKSYVYYVQGVAPEGGTTDSEPQIIQAPVFEGVWIHDPLTPDSTVEQYRYGNIGRSESLTVSSVASMYVGRTYPVYDLGRNESRVVGLNIQVPYDQDEQDIVDGLRLRVRNRRTLCYRDGRGRLIYGVIDSLDINDSRIGTEVSCSITTVDYKEGI